MMPELLRSTIRTAQKPHRCSLCCEEIKPGEKYGYDTYKYDGRVYDWKSHLECEAVSTFLFDYVDPDCGMTSDDFCDACADVCRVFACPDCENFDADGASVGDYCKKGNSFCVHKLYELSQKYVLSMVRDKTNGCLKWRLVPIKEENK